MNILKIVVGIIAVVVIGNALSGGTFFGLLNFAQEAFQQAPTQKQGEIKDFSNENGYVEIKPTDDKKVLRVGSVEKIDVNVTLKDKQIVGFNVPVQFDNTKYQVTGVENADSRFNMYLRREGDKDIILVAVQQATNTDKIDLYKATVARILFRVINPGVSHMTVRDKTPKGYELKLVNEKNDALYPSYGDLQITAR